MLLSTTFLTPLIRRTVRLAVETIQHSTLAHLRHLTASAEHKTVTQLTLIPILEDIRAMIVANTLLHLSYPHHMGPTKQIYQRRMKYDNVMSQSDIRLRFKSRCT